MGQNLRHTKKLTAIALLAALAFLFNYLSRFTPPIFPVPPLRYDAKDIIIVISGFALGPSAALIVIFVSSFFEIWIGTAGFPGFVMNVLSSTAFALPPILIFRGIGIFGTARGGAPKAADGTGNALVRSSPDGAAAERSLKSLPKHPGGGYPSYIRVGVGLAIGTLFTTAWMLFWNWLLTPIIVGMPRQVIVENVLWQVILPFNLIKSGINAVAVMLAHRPVLKALRRSMRF